MLLIENLKKDWKSGETHQKVYIVLGGIALLLALIGVMFPVVPQVPFAIVAALFFSKGSPHVHEWIRENKYFGRPVKDWEDHRAIRPKLKLLSVFAMVGAGIFGHYKLLFSWALLLDFTLAICIVFVLTRKASTVGRPILRHAT